MVLNLKTEVAAISFNKQSFFHLPTSRDKTTEQANKSQYLREANKVRTWTR